MSNRVYAVCIPELRSPGGYGPEMYDTFMPMGLFVAESNSHARSLAFGTWASQLSSGVYSDDYVNLRARIIDYEAGWEDGEFFHALPVGEVNGGGRYIEYLWNQWPKDFTVKQVQLPERDVAQLG